MLYKVIDEAKQEVRSRILILCDKIFTLQTEEDIRVELKEQAEQMLTSRAYSSQHCSTSYECAAAPYLASSR